MSYDETCGWCRAAIDLADETGNAWVEADGCNLCRACFDALMDNDEAAEANSSFMQRRAPNADEVTR